MSYRSVIITLALTAVVFGALVSGCNRNRRTAARLERGREVAQARRGVRPAEVLSSSAYRPQPTLARVRTVGPAIAEPLPEPVMVAQVPSSIAPVSYAYSSPASPSRPRPVSAGPELAMARSALAPMPAPAPRGYRQRISSAPIPELEPVSRRRLPAARTAARPVAEVMMSANHAPQELQRALAPLGAPVVAEQSWVSSPTTAMR